MTRDIVFAVLSAYIIYIYVYIIDNYVYAMNNYIYYGIYIETIEIFAIFIELKTGTAPIETRLPMKKTKQLSVKVSYNQELELEPVNMSIGLRLNSFVMLVSSCWLSIPSSLKTQPFRVTVSADQSEPA